MKYCLWCMAETPMRFTPTKYTTEWIGEQLPVCVGHALMVMMFKEVCI